MYRSATSQSCRALIRTPTPIEEVENRKRVLLSRNASRRSPPTQGTFKEISTPFRETGATFNRPQLITASNSKKYRGFLSQNFN